MNKQLLLLALFFIVTNINAQKPTRIELTEKEDINIENLQQSDDGFIIKETISNIEFTEIETKEGSYLQLFSEGMSKSYDEGNPNLPIIGRLIEIPANKDVQVRIVSYKEKIIDLAKYNLNSKIIPAQASVSKSADPEDLPFIKNEKVYSKNAFYKNVIVNIEDRGYLRNKHIGYIEISPFEYNPVSNELKVLNDIEIEVKFVEAAIKNNFSSKKYTSTYFENLNIKTVNNVDDSKAIIEGPIKYVIVSDPMFEETLQPFIEWKIRKGFNVIEAYTDDPNVGSTTSTIKAYLQDLYVNSEDGISPTFILFVGDVAQIPVFSGEAGSHYTDLYYCEYTGDDLPEVFYGRFSATSVAELQPQIDKTLEVEKYQIPDPSYLNNVVLVAGVDGTYAPTYGNGFLNYANDYYINSENGITSKTYYYPESGSADVQVREDISAGVAIANYTAHCSSSGWADPSFQNSNVATMTNEHMYPLMIGNCCLSNKFNDASCFGETLLRAEGKGAVGYIGGSNNTYWDEDYWWGVGLNSPTVNPTYENSGLGAYDRFFHQYGEEKDDWYITQGQMIVAGNLAVEASSSSRKTYYWEIYHLMGDPSLTPYVKVPESMDAEYDSVVVINTSSFQLVVEENAYVALTRDSIILDAKLVNESGIVNLEFDTIKEVGEVYLVITKQNKQPIIDTLDIIGDSKPNVYIRDFSFSEITGNGNQEIDYGETAALDVLLENSSALFNAEGITLNITSEDTNVIILDNSENIASLNASESTELIAPLTFQFKNRFEDKQQVKFNVELTWNDITKGTYNKTYQFNSIVNAPILKINDLIIDDSSENNDGVFDPGETVKFILEIENKGSSLIQDVIGKILNANGTDKLIIADSTTTPTSLNPDETKQIEFTASLNEYEDFGVPISIDFIVQENNFNFYTSSATKEIVLGDSETIKISEAENVLVGNKGAYFYDSGGEDNNYKDNESYTITFFPEDINSKVSAKFLMFDIEYYSDCRYDKMSIYDSSLVDAAALIDVYCGTNSPGIVTATNPEGALTFVFTSDVGVTEPGWKAMISQTGTYKVTFNIFGNNGQPLNDVTISMGDDSKQTNEDGLAKFYNVVPAAAINYVLSKADYISYSGTCDVKNSDVNIYYQMTLTGIDKDIVSKIKVFPNPSNGIFNIEMQDLSEQVFVVKVYDLVGNLIFIENIDYGNSTFEIDLTDKSKGIYILSIESGNGSALSKRILIQ